MLKLRKANPFKQDIQLHARALTGDYSLKIVWKKMGPGMAAGYDFVSNVILLPKVNVVELEERDIVKLKALSYHERLHHAITDFEPVKKAAGIELKNGKVVEVPPNPKDVIKPGHMLKTMLNFLEDCRIELNENYRLPGDLEDLISYRKQESYEQNFQYWELSQYMNPWGALMVALQYNLCDYADIEIIPPLKPYYDAAWEILNDGRFHKSLKVKQPGTDVMLTLAKEILKKWKQDAEADPNVIKVKVEADGMESDMLSEGEESDGEGKSKKKKNKSKDQKAKGKKGQKSDPSDEDEDEEGSASGEGEESDGEGEESDDDYDMEDEFDKGQERQDGKYAVNPNQLNEDVSDMAREKVKEAAERVKKEKEAAERAEQNKAEEATEESRKLRRQRRMDEIKHTDYIPYDILDRTWVAKAFPDAYANICEKIQDKIMFARKELTKALLCLTQDEINTGLKTGRLDQRRLAKLSVGSDRVFFKKREGLKMKTAVQLVIDLSGSMQSGISHDLTRAGLAVQVATLFGEVFQILRVPFEIIGFNTSQLGSSDSDSAEASGCNRTGDIVNRWIFKTFEENFLLVRDRLGACEYSMNGGYSGNNANSNGCVGGCNIDHEVILWGAARLWKQSAQRKIQIVLSDGLPSGYNGDYGGLLPEMLLQTNKKIERSGIDQYAFGMHCEEVQNYYSKYKVIQSLDDMNEEALRFLASSFHYGPARN